MPKIRRVPAAAVAAGAIAVVSACLPACGVVVAGQVDDFEDGTVQNWETGGLVNPVPGTNVSTGGPSGADDNFFRITSIGGAGAGSKLVTFNTQQWAGDYLGEGISAIQMQVSNLGATDLTLRLIFGDFSSGQSLCTVAPVNLPAGSGWQTVAFPLVASNLEGGDFGTVMSSVAELNLIHSPLVTSHRSGAPSIVAQLGVDNITAVPTPASVYYWDINGQAAGSGGTAPSGNWDGVSTNFNTDSSGGSGTLVASPGIDDTVVFSAGNDATGSYTVTVTGTQTAAQLMVEEGNVTFAGGTLAVGAFDVSTGATGTVTSTVAAPNTALTKTGVGTLQVSKLPQNHAVTINAGTIRILESDPGYASGLPAGNPALVSQVPSLALDLGTVLDITNNDVIIDYSGDSPAAEYEALVRSAYNTVGTWDGPGITSSIAAIDGSYVVAIADNAALAAPFGTAQGGALFNGVDVDLTSVLIKFTHRVDINLDGLITPDDAAIFGTFYDESITSGHVWAAGDMDFDGACTPSDAAIFGTFYDESLASLPEPMAAGATIVLVPALLRGRRSANRTSNANNG